VPFSTGFLDKGRRCTYSLQLDGFFICDAELDAIEDAAERATEADAEYTAKLDTELAKNVTATCADVLISCELIESTSSVFDTFKSCKIQKLISARSAADSSMRSVRRCGKWWSGSSGMDVCHRA
jgi:hypothetical protein